MMCAATTVRHVRNTNAEMLESFKRDEGVVLQSRRATKDIPGSATTSRWEDEECVQLLYELGEGREMSKEELTKQHVFVFSHRRSGTHMTINLIRSAFDDVFVWKTNHVSCANCSKIAAIRSCGGHIVHAYRNPYDVAISLYNFRKRNTLSLEEFLRTTRAVEVWKNFTQNCFSVPGMLSVQFEMTRQNPALTVGIIKDHLKVEGSWTRTSIPHTDAVSYHGGKIGGWEKFSGSFLKEFLNNSTGDWVKGGCDCDSSGFSDDSHPCSRRFSPYMSDTD